MSASLSTAAKRALYATGFTLMGILITAGRAWAQVCPPPQQFCPGAGGCIGPRDLCLLEPTPGGVAVIPASSTSNLGAFLTYVNDGIWVWAFGVAIGIAVLNGVFGGFQIMLGNPDEGKPRFIWSTVGLLLLLLSGTILAFINPVGFTSV